MIYHHVWLTFKPETTNDEQEAAFAHIQELQQKIAGITQVMTGENLNKTNNHGFTHGFTLVFDTEEHFRAYAPHPDHQPVSQELQRICSSIIDFDLPQ